MTYPPPDPDTAVDPQPAHPHDHEWGWWHPVARDGGVTHFVRFCMSGTLGGNCPAEQEMMQLELPVRP